MTVLRSALLLTAVAAARAADPVGQVFPPSDPWNVDVSAFPVHARSADYVASIGPTLSLHPDFGTTLGGAPWGIPYVVVSGTQPKVPIAIDYEDESDPGPYPVPADAPIEGGPSATGDRHVIVIDKDNRALYELFAAFPETGGGWRCGSGAIFDLQHGTTRPAGWTSADAAGLPIFPGLARYDEVAAGAIRHALRFTVVISQKAYVYPARHYASSNTDVRRPPMGLRMRLKAGTSLAGLGPQATIIATALKRYGMMVADNGGNWFVSGAPDPHWDDADIDTLKRLKGSDFEAVDTSSFTSGGTTSGTTTGGTTTGGSTTGGTTTGGTTTGGSSTNGGSSTGGSSSSGTTTGAGTSSSGNNHLGCGHGAALSGLGLSALLLARRR